MKKKEISVAGGRVVTAAEPSKFAKIKASLKRNGKKIIVIGSLVIILVGTTVYFKYCAKNNDLENTNDNNDEPKQEEIEKEEEYSRELLNARIKSFTEDINNKGINLTESEVRDFAAFMNMDVIIKEDPELAKELFEGKNPEEIISNAGHVISVLISYSFKNDYKNSVNLSTLVVGKDHDKLVLSTLEKYRDELTTMRAEEPGEHRVEFATKEEEEKFNQIITEVLNFAGMSVDGLAGENVYIQKMGEGNRFVLMLVMNEIAKGNKNILTEQQYMFFQELMSNENTVANIIKLIKGCIPVDTNEVQYTK